MLVYPAPFLQAFAAQHGRVHRRSVHLPLGFGGRAREVVPGGGKMEKLVVIGFLLKYISGHVVSGLRTRSRFLRFTGNRGSGAGIFRFPTQTFRLF